ncbi:MAG: TonB-dependent receptor domain-containing protein [Acidobacteriota bacterium]
MNRSTRIVFALLSGIVILTSLSSLTYGQVASRITGIVQDPTGAVIPGIEVTVRDVNRGTTRTTVTNERGNYSFPNLSSGVYIISAELPGFKTATSDELRLEVNQTLQFNIRMEIGEVTDQIQVTGAAPLLQTSDSQVGGVIENKQVVDFPIQARDFMQLALTVAGVVESTDNNRHQTERATWQGSFSVHGISADYNQYLLDGMSAKEHQHATNSFAPNIDMIQEMKIETSNYSAEFGSEAGGHINIVTKSGTNNLHGTLFWFNRNSAFGARERFADDKPFQNRNAFGAVFGGPIVRDRTFWFFSWEDTRLRKGFASNTTVPTPAMKRGDFSALLGTDESNPTPITIYDWTTGEPFPNNVIPQSRIHPLAERFINEFVPDPNRPGVGGIRPVNNFQFADTQKTDSPQLSGRIDHNFTDTDRLFYRLSWSDTSTVAPQVWPAFGYTQDMAVYHTVLTYSKTLSPTSMFELKAGYSRFNQIERTESAFVRDVAGELGLKGACSANPSCYHAPFWSVQDFSTMGNPSGPTRGQGVSGPRGWINDIYETGGHFFMTRGNHNLRMGLDVRHYRDTFPEAIRPAGQHSFNGQWTASAPSRGTVGPPSEGFALADALLGLPRRIQASIDIFDPNFSNFAFFPWIQDDWKVTQKLTLNLGLRYEWSGRPRSRNDSISNFLEVGPGPGRIMTPADRPPPPGFSDTFIPAPAEFGRALLHNDNNNLAPRFGFAYRATEKTVVRGAYGIFYQRDNACTWIGLSINSPWIRTGDVSLEVTQEDFEAFPVDDLTPVVNFVEPGSKPSVIALNVDWRDAYVQQWNLYIDRSITDTIVARMGYVGNHAINLRKQVSPFNSPPPGPGSIQSRRPFQDLSSITMRTPVGQSTYHGLELQLENRYSNGLSFVTAYTFSKTLDNMQNLDVWFGGNGEVNKGPSGLHISDRFTFSGIYELPFGPDRRYGNNMSGVLNAILGDWDISSIVVLRTGNPLFVTTRGNIANTQGIAQVPLRLGEPNLDRGDRDWDRFFNTDVFANPDQFTLGDAGVRPLFGPGNRRWDFAIYKRFNFDEQKQLQFRAEFFNFTNHPNMGNPSASFGSASFGKVTSTWSLDSPREIQFGLKLLF